MDAGILEQVLYHIHNWFVYDETSGYIDIQGGSLPASVSVPEGAWYRIQGSLFNDGLHQQPADDLTDETFDGTVTTCAIPKALLDVVDRIADWLDEAETMRSLYRNARQKASEAPYASESFDGYSYTIGTGTAPDLASDGSTRMPDWQAEFARELNPWRKIS